MQQEPLLRHAGSAGLFPLLWVQQDFLWYTVLWWAESKNPSKLSSLSTDESEHGVKRRESYSSQDLEPSLVAFNTGNTQSWSGEGHLWGTLRPSGESVIPDDRVLRSGDPFSTHTEGNTCWEQTTVVATAGWCSACNRTTSSPRSQPHHLLRA